MGDWVWLQAFRLALDEHHFRVLSILIEAAKMMTEGEVMELCQRGRLDVTELDVLETASRKSAWLFGVCMQLGALLGHKDQAEEDRFFRCGMHLGLAFQIIRDLAEVLTPPAAESGIPVAANPQGSRMNLPLVYTLEKSDHPTQSLISEVITGKGSFLTTVQKVAVLARDLGAIERTRDLAYRLAIEGCLCLEPFLDFRCMRALEWICQIILAPTDLEQPHRTVLLNLGMFARRT